MLEGNLQQSDEKARNILLSNYKEEWEKRTHHASTNAKRCHKPQFSPSHNIWKNAKLFLQKQQIFPRFKQQLYLLVSAAFENKSAATESRLTRIIKDVHTCMDLTCSIKKFHRYEGVLTASLFSEISANSSDWVHPGERDSPS